LISPLSREYTGQVADFYGIDDMTREEAASLLTQRGVLPTAQRIDIALLTLARPQHVSAEHIIAAIRASGLKISKATVYNTLNLFREQGLLRTVDVDPTRQFYDSSTTAHHHFYNVDTGELTDIPLESVMLHVDTALPPGTEQAGVDVVVRVRGHRVG
jgi:Fur family transcriptional regulator, iron response regulator